MYEFGQQLGQGERGERLLDQFFAAEYLIRPASPREQRQGIDRHFRRRDDGSAHTVEYKTDYLAFRTGYAFIETVSVDATGKRGWAYSSQADYLLYLVFGDRLVYAIRMETVRAKLAGWLRKYRQRAAENRGYRTHGVLVPLAELEACCEQAICL